jgi:glycosyltransferase involved in cell wall biosynthesis
MRHQSKTHRSHWIQPPPRSRGQQRGGEEVDVCLIVEGCYPYRRGGVSNWVDTLLCDQAGVSFAIISIQPPGAEPTPLYALPPNVRVMRRLELGGPARARRWPEAPSSSLSCVLANALADFSRSGRLQTLARIVQLARGTDNLTHIGDTRLGWDITCRMYRDTAPTVSFLNYYWTWRSLVGGLFAILAHPLPQAAVFHAASTGFAGLLAARAVIETGRPALLTEHGIYTNERLIEVLMADWISEDIDLSLSVSDLRVSLRSFLIDCFESYARTCYEASSAIVSLFSENQVFQRELGANPAKLRIIPNGVRWQDFSELPAASVDAPPTVGLIGRVVPFKDVKTFLFAVRLARERLVNLRAFVFGDLEEDAAYAAQCRTLAYELELADCVEFTGAVDISKILPRLHLMVLTSLTESQPLAVLEAGAAGVACIATDVGACREMLLGFAGIDGGDPGGIVTRPLAPKEVADAMVRLLTEPELRRRYGKALQTRVRRYYDRDRVRQEYSALYAEYCGIPTSQAAWNVR